MSTHGDDSEPDDAKTIEELLAVMHEHDLDRLKVTSGDATYELVRREPGMVSMTTLVAASGAVPSTAEVQAKPPNVKRVIAPLTGVFYRSSSPDAEVFVSEGSRVEVGSVLCILEAMKLFNEIQSDYAGTVVRILPQNSELVSQGEELFWISP